MSDIPEYLSEWITQQRWFGGKGRAPQWERLGGFALDDPFGAPSDDVRVVIHLLLDRAEPPLLYQVPLVERREPLEGATAIGVTSDGRHLYDGPRDRSGAAAILRLMLDEATARPDDGAPGLAARGHSLPDVPALEIAGSRVLSGEQSNTSIIFDVVTLDGQPATPVICKVFRTLHHGDNPDVTLTSAITGAGSTVVPHSVGHITGQWRDVGEPTGYAHGHLAFAQEFLSGVEDAWRVALAAAQAGDDFAERARALGEATADIHLTLAAALPTHASSAVEVDAVVSSMRRRFDAAVAEVPSLEAHRAAVDDVYAQAESADWPPFQRIHGDYHLGQVLSVRDRGWVALDFEGEPLRPMAERAVPDSPLRDVAGMLRSFDYAAGSVAQSAPDAAAGAAEWAASARSAFLEGYASRAGLDLAANSSLLAAFELDKALYEAVYEARNRPSWLRIPVDAIDRLVGRGAAPVE